MTEERQERINHHIHQLITEIGPRMIGTTANRSAAKYIYDQFGESDIAVKLQRFDCVTWSAEPPIIAIGEETTDRHVVVNTFSPPCEVTAPMVACNSLAQLESASLVGKIVLMYGDLTKQPIAAKGSPFYLPDKHRRINELLESKRPAAAILVSPRFADPLPIIEDWDIVIPSVTVSAANGIWLLRNLDKSVHLTILTEHSMGQGRNVIATIPGDRPERIVICAHFDTKINTPGAVDNGAAVVALLTLAAELAKLPHKATIEFIAFNGEEYYGLGDTEYLNHYEATFPAIIATINMDGIGQWTGTTTIAPLAHSEAFGQTLIDLVQVNPHVVLTEPWYASNHYTFFSKGVPCVAVSSVGVDDIGHFVWDDVGWLDSNKIEEVVKLVLDLVKVIETKSIAWSRP